MLAIITSNQSIQILNVFAQQYIKNQSISHHKYMHYAYKNAYWRPACQSRYKNIVGMAESDLFFFLSVLLLILQTKPHTNLTLVKHLTKI